MYTIVDVSNNNGGAVDFHRLKEAKIAGVLLKATEGVSFDDATFTARRKAANAAGLRVGAYHFAHPEKNAARDEARHFVKAVKTLDRRDFKPVLDFEQGTPNSTTYPAWIRQFNKAVLAGLGSYPIFYSYPFYIQGLHLTTPVGNGLWLASYGRNDGKDYGAVVPAPWKKWDLHQYSSNATVGGVEGKVDLSHAVTLNGLLAHPIAGRL